MPVAWRRDSRVARNALVAAVFAAMATCVMLVMAARSEAATFTPVADSHVHSGHPTTNYGTRVSLETDGDPIRTTYMKFNVQGTGPVSSARLRVFVETENTTGFQVHSVADTSWTESGLNYNNAPALGPVVSSSGPVAANSWYSIDVSSLVSDEGVVGFALTSLSSSSTNYSSKEGPNSPQLLAPAPPAVTEYVITRDGDTYTATPQSEGSTFTGTMKFAVENAMHDLDGSGGGTITFGAGIFDLGNTWLELRDIRNVTFQGQGMDATVIQNASGLASDTEPFDGSTTHFLTIRDLQIFAGGTLRSTSDAIDLDGGNDALIERVKITGSRARGIVFDGKDIVNSVVRTSDRNIVRDCVITGVPSHGIELLAANENRIEGCTITNVAGYGIQLNKASTIAGQPHKKSNDNVLIQNYIDNSGWDGIAIISGDRNEILENTVLNSSDDSSGRSGIRIMMADSIPCDDNVVTGNTATDNQTPKTQTYGLFIASPLCNRTVVSGNDFSGNLGGPIQDMGTDTLYSPAELSLTKVGSADTVRVGEDVTYTIDVANGGPSSATSVTVTDILPAGLSHVSATPSQGSCSEATGTVTCGLGTVASSASAQVQIVAHAESAGEITNTASVAASEPEGNTANNSDPAATTVSPVADLSIVKSDSPDPVSAGSDFTYTLAVANAGPSSASGVTVTDSLPAGLTYLGATPSQGSCSQAAGTVTCGLGTLANSASAQVQIFVRRNNPGQVTNTASVSGADHDPNSVDNSDSETTTVNPAAPSYPRPGGGSPLSVPLVPEFAACTPENQNTTHIGPLDAPACTPAVHDSALTISAVGRGQASARFNVIPGDLSTAADEANVEVQLSIADVKRASDGADYTGSVVLATALRITDRSSGPNADQPATVEDIDFGLPTNCVATASVDRGSNCNLQSTTDSLVPGFAKERSRAVISMLSIEVLDAGTDGILTPAVDPLGQGCPPTCGSGDEKVFLRQGVFAP